MLVCFGLDINLRHGLNNHVGSISKMILKTQTTCNEQRKQTSLACNLP
jgi:hypothetical protein